MVILDEKTNLKAFFSDTTLVKQRIFKAKKHFVPLYVNARLYEELFNEKYNEQEAFKKFSDIFSITLDKNKSTDEEIGYGYADRQEDPMGISLSGNQGSGRAYFYGKYFNIKGDKTSLATSPKEIYSNGKFSLEAAIKESIISNILSQELAIPPFETLAILDTSETFEFIVEYLATDDTVKEERFVLPSVIEIRVNKDKKMYRISNAFANKDRFTFEQLKSLCDRLAFLESEKYLKRFLHGSWSVGNISVDANLIDFDTAAFVQGRNPQYSNTNKYKSNYFGYEMLGSKKILELLSDNARIDLNNNYQYLEKYFDLKYNEYLKEGFCELIGLNNSIYTKHTNTIDILFEKFVMLSKLFLPNYYDLSVLEENNRNTFIFDFSRFFQKYLIGRKNDNRDILYGVNLLLNDAKSITYKKVGFIKDKVEEFFSDNIITESDSHILEEAIEFVNLYNGLFNQIASENDLNEIKFKQYISNMNRTYLYGYEPTFSVLSQLYVEKKIDNTTLNKIINHLIKTNIRVYKEQITEYLCDLKLFEHHLSYKVITKQDYYYVIVPYKDCDVRFAKLFIDDKEYMFHHIEDSENLLYSDRIHYDDISDLELDTHIRINGKAREKQLILTELSSH